MVARVGARWGGVFFGGPGRVRTVDLFHAMEARSQLRHRPTNRAVYHAWIYRCDLEQVDAGNSQHPDHQPERDHGHYDVPNPLRRSLRFGPIFHQAFLRRCFAGGAGSEDFRNASSFGSSICASSISTPSSSGFFLGSLISRGSFCVVAMATGETPKDRKRFPR